MLYGDCATKWLWRTIDMVKRDKETEIGVVGTW